MLDLSMRVHEFKFRKTWYKPMSKVLPVLFFSTRNPQCYIFQRNSDLIFVLKWRTFFEMTKYKRFRIYNRVTDGSSPVVHLNKLPPYVSIALVFFMSYICKGEKISEYVSKQAYHLIFKPYVITLIQKNSTTQD